MPPLFMNKQEGDCKNQHIHWNWQSSLHVSNLPPLKLKKSENSNLILIPLETLLFWYSLSLFHLKRERETDLWCTPFSCELEGGGESICLARTSGSLDPKSGDESLSSLGITGCCETLSATNMPLDLQVASGKLGRVDNTVPVMGTPEGLANPSTPEIVDIDCCKACNCCRNSAQAIGETNTYHLSITSSKLHTFLWYLHWTHTSFLLT